MVGERLSVIITWDLAVPQPLSSRSVPLLSATRGALAVILNTRWMSRRVAREGYGEGAPLILPASGSQRKRRPDSRICISFEGINDSTLGPYVSR